MTTDYTLMVKINGRLDTGTSPELDSTLAEIMSSEKIKEVRFDFSDLEYISSSGLRVLLATLKKVSAFGGTVHIENASEYVKTIFSMTGFNTMFLIE